MTLGTIGTTRNRAYSAGGNSRTSQREAAPAPDPVFEELRAAFRDDWKFAGRVAHGSRYDGLQN